MKEIKKSHIIPTFRNPQTTLILFRVYLLNNYQSLSLPASWRSVILFDRAQKKYSCNERLQTFFLKNAFSNVFQIYFPNFLFIFILRKRWKVSLKIITVTENNYHKSQSAVDEIIQFFVHRFFV